MQAERSPVRRGALTGSRATLPAIGFAVAVGALAAQYAGAGLPLPTDLVYHAIEVAAVAACVVRAARHRRERTSWAMIAAAIASFTIGDLYYTLAFREASEVPFPSVADAFYLGFYPFGYAGVILLWRARAGRGTGAVWLDALAGALAVAALGVAVAYHAVLTQTGGPALTVATNLAYPLGDLFMLMLLAGALTVTGRPSWGTWTTLIGAFCLFAVVDTVYLYQTAKGTYELDTVLDAGWPAALALLAVAAWQRPASAAARAGRGWSGLVVSVGAGLVAGALLVADHYTRLSEGAVLLAMSGLLVVVVRLAVTFAAHRRLLDRAQEDALTDSLTGLGNRRALLAALECALDRPGAPTLLVALDLNGFKAYNDAFGMAAGDARLVDLAGRLTATLGDQGRAYRVGGDEFHVVLPADDRDPADGARRAAAALAEPWSPAGCSHGHAVVPTETASALDALDLADRRRRAAEGPGPTATELVLSAASENRALLGAPREDAPPAAPGPLRWARDLADFVPRGGRLDPADWERHHRFVLVTLGLLTVGIAVAAVLGGYGLLHALGHVAPLLAFAAGATTCRLSRPSRALCASAGLMVAAALMVHLADGMIEAHFGFFALLPLVALYGTWRPLALAVAFVLVEHFVVGTLHREAVFEADGGPATRLAVIHGAYVLAASAMCLAAWRLQHVSRQGLVRALGDSDTDLRRTVARLEAAQAETVRRLSKAVEFRDEETGAHAERIGRHSATLAEAAGLGRARCELIRMAAPLHDVGKVAIPDAILLKPAALSAAERLVIERHAAEGHGILSGSSSPVLELAATIALTHHERWDGSGYPRRLAGADIPVEGRIVAIADVFDALTTDRVYRPAFPHEVALDMMRAERGAHFDAELLDLFLALVESGRLAGDGDAGATPAPGLRAA
jgi:HD-GYP domain-containing protein (c-di-GMP phosphodiesterase class II)/GGDEF domain-containing protein